MSVSFIAQNESILGDRRLSRRPACVVLRLPILLAAVAVLLGAGHGFQTTVNASTEDFDPTIEWISEEDGNWEEPQNWSEDRLPVPGDDVLIDVESDVSITLSVGHHVVERLFSDEELRLAGGSLEVTGSATLNSEMVLEGGTLRGGPWEGTERIVTGDVSTLQDVILGVDLRIENGDEVSVDGDLILDGARIFLASSGSITRLHFRYGEPQTLGGVGEVVFADTGESSADRHRLELDETGTVLTIGPDVTVRTDGAGGQIRGRFLVGDPELINKGTISARGEGLVVEVGDRTSGVRNEGELAVAEGGRMEAYNLHEELNSVSLSGTASTMYLNGDYTINSDIELPEGTRLDIAGDWINEAALKAADAGLGLGGADGDWSNAGAITVENTIVDLAGEFAVADLGDFQRTGGTVNLTGTWDNRDDTLHLEETLGGNLTLAGGRFRGGVIASDVARILTAGESVLESVELAADLSIGDGDRLHVESGLTLQGATLSIESAGELTHLIFRGGEPQVLGGHGEVVFADDRETEADRHSFELEDSGTEVTIGPEVTVRAAEAGGRIWSRSIGDETGIINKGVISAQTGAGTVALGQNMASVLNEGRLEARNLGTLQVENLANLDGTRLEEGTYRVEEDGVLRIEGADIETNAADIELAGAGSELVNEDDNDRLTHLNANEGLLALSGGRNLSLADSLKNSGDLSVGRASAITVDGDFEQSSEGQFTVHLDSDHGHLNVGETALLDGTLLLQVEEDFNPYTAPEMIILSARSVSGVFEEIEESGTPAVSVADVRHEEHAVIVRMDVELITFQNWLNEHDLENAPYAEPFGDPGGYGIPMLLRYAFNLDPSHPDRSGLPNDVDFYMEGEDEKYLTITYTRRLDATDLKYRVQGGTDLRDLVTLSDQEELLVGIEKGEDQTTEKVTRRDVVPISESDRRFLQVKVFLDSE